MSEVNDLSEDQSLKQSALDRFTEDDSREILEIIQLIRRGDLRYFELIIGDLRITASSHSDHQGPATRMPSDISDLERSVGDRQATVAKSSEASAESDDGMVHEPSDDDDDTEASTTEVVAPIVGVFYRSPEPGASPFVELGQIVEEGETMGLVEVMKMFNSVTSPARGTVTEILAENGAFVEYGEVLFRVRPVE